MTRESHRACCCRWKRQIRLYLPVTLTLVAVCKPAKTTGESPVSLYDFLRFLRIMATHVRGIFRVLQHLSPLPAVRIPRSQPAVGVSGLTTLARTMVVGTIMHDDTGGVFSNERGPSVVDLDAIFFFSFFSRCLVKCGQNIGFCQNVCLFLFL